MKDTMEERREEAMATMVHYATIGAAVLTLNELGYQTVVKPSETDGGDILFRDAVDIHVSTYLLTVIFTVKTSVKYNTVTFGSYRVVFDDIAHCNDPTALETMGTVGDVVNSLIEEMTTNTDILFN